MLKKYLNKLSEYPRLRVLLIIIVVIFVVVVLFDLFTPNGNSGSSSPIAHSQIQGVNPNQDQHRTRIGAEKYNREQQERERNAYENKIKHGSDVFKGLFGNDTKTTTTKAPSRSPMQIQKQARAQAQPARHTQPPPLSPTQVMNYRHASQAQPTESTNDFASPESQQEQAAKRALEAKFKSALQSSQSKWAIPSMTQVGSVAVESENQNANAAGSKLAGPVMIKSGTILFAVLENTLNSDQPNTPVLAVIAAGKYRGARLLGNFTREKEKLVVKFSQLITKNADGAISINAYAVDPKTAENALATSVNHHYLERYGSMFAASLIQGFGNAFSNYQNPCQGTNNCFISGSVQRPDVTTKTALYQGIGQIGTNVSSNVQNNFNLPVTVKLKRGTGVGILFMSDVRNSTTPYANVAQNKLGNLAALSHAAHNLATGIDLTPPANTPTVPQTPATQPVSNVSTASRQMAPANSAGQPFPAGQASQPVQPQF